MFIHFIVSLFLLFIGLPVIFYFFRADFKINYSSDFVLIKPNKAPLYKVVFMNIVVINFISSLLFNDGIGWSVLILIFVIAFFIFGFQKVYRSYKNTPLVEISFKDGHIIIGKTKTLFHNISGIEYRYCTVRYARGYTLYVLSNEGKKPILQSQNRKEMERLISLFESNTNLSITKTVDRGLLGVKVLK